MFAPLCVVLLKAKGVIDGATRNRDELEELQATCGMIMLQVIENARKVRHLRRSIRLPLVECVDKLADVARRYHEQATFARAVRFLRDGGDVRRLPHRIDAVVLIVGLGGVMNVMEQLDNVRQMLVSKPA